MRFEVVGIFFFFLAHYAQGHHSEVRIDDRGNYFTHQNIVKAFDKSQPPWLYGYNFENSREYNLQDVLKTVKEEQCTYFKKDYLNSTHVNFSRHGFEDKKPMPAVPLYGTFFKTLALGDDSKPTNRTDPNGVSVADSPGGEAKFHLKLIYSDYNNCAILRPYTPGSDQAEYPGASYRGTTGACILVLSDVAAREMGKEEKKKEDKKKNEESRNLDNEKENDAKKNMEERTLKRFPQNAGKPLPVGLSKRMPYMCGLIYPQACGSEKFTVVFKQSCPTIPNALGC